MTLNTFNIDAHLTAYTQGAFCHIRAHDKDMDMSVGGEPISIKGAPYYDEQGQAVGFIVMSSFHKSCIGASMKMLALTEHRRIKIIQRAWKPEDEEKYQNDVLSLEIELAAAVVIEPVNLTSSNFNLKTIEGRIKFFSDPLFAYIRHQIVEFAKDNNNFLTARQHDTTPLAGEKPSRAKKSTKK